MLSTLLKIIPLDLAATLSPGILALVLITLASKNHPKAHVLSLFFGSLFVGLGITLLGFILGSSINAPSGIKQNSTESIVDIILGLFLIFYGLKMFFSQERKISSKEEEHALKIFKWFALGLILTITNFDALFLNFVAAKEVGGAEIQPLAKWLLLAINLIFFTLPISLPILLNILFPKIAGPILGKIEKVTLKYGRFIVLAMFLIFGIVLLYEGMKFFF